MSVISLGTISSRIREAGEFNSYWAASKPFISKKNQKCRLQWCQEHIKWSPEQWRRILWSDESPFVLRYNSKKRVWRMANERYAQNCIGGTVKHDKKIMVWASFAVNGVGVLRRIEGIMNTDVYLDILDHDMLPSAQTLFSLQNWTFQQDNDPKHTSRRTQDWFRVHNISVLPWPAQSPDLNPIENLWSILDRNCNFRKVNNVTELFECLSDEWKKIPVNLLERLVESMPSRCQAVIDAKGLATKY
jgi:hypothetical protein